MKFSQRLTPVHYITPQKSQKWDYHNVRTP